MSLGFYFKVVRKILMRSLYLILLVSMLFCGGVQGEGLSESFYDCGGFDFTGEMKKKKKKINISGSVLLDGNCSDEAYYKLSGVYRYNKVGKDIALTGYNTFRGHYFMTEGVSGGFVLREITDNSGLLEGTWANGKDVWNVKLNSEYRNINLRYYSDNKKIVAERDFFVKFKYQVGHKRLLRLKVENKFDVEISEISVDGERYDMFHLSYDENKELYTLGMRRDINGSAYGDPLSCEYGISNKGKVVYKNEDCPDNLINRLIE